MNVTDDIEEYYKAAEGLVLTAGKIIEGAINLNKNIKIKGIEWDLVTEYDRRIEDDLKRQLSNMYPQHKNFQVYW
ncbi:inositol monophosphatase 2-like [Ceratina calcarata]|uniref:Inositol monophosphatase 2-like n=1 Tax=Ceratina calcarata TaxID=156304 RepID=A0AAJ7WD78_9HYME|nr:inositol monophosphatase 2-like [Ceratina calcarata]